MESTALDVCVNVNWNLNPDCELALAMREHGVRRLAVLLGVSPQTVSNWLAGKTMPDDALRRVCAEIRFTPPGVTMRQRAGNDPPRLDWTDAVRRKRNLKRVRAGGAA